MTFDRNFRRHPWDQPQSRRDVTAALALGLAGLAMAPAARAAQAGEAFRSRRIRVRVSGKGPDVILIPGLATGPAVWNPVIAAVGGYRFHTVHIHGFAGLEAGLNAAGPLLDPVAGEIARYISEAALRRPAIVGHSMGGTLAMLVALAKPCPVSRAMVVDMLPDGAGMLGGTSQGLGYLAAQMNGYLTGTKAGRQMLTDMVRQSPAGRDSDPVVISRALAELAQRNLTPMLSRLGCPLEVVYAMPQDARLKITQGQRYKTAYAGNRTAEIRGIGPSGHMVMQDQPVRFAAALRQFLAG